MRSQPVQGKLSGPPRDTDGLLYGYVTVVPICLYLILKYFSAPSVRPRSVVLSLRLIPFCIHPCYVAPYDILRWVVAGVSGSMSSTFVALNFRTHIESAGSTFVTAQGRLRCSNGDGVIRVMPSLIFIHSSSTAPY